jgi:uncharacterized membrane protein
MKIRIKQHFLMYAPIYAFTLVSSLIYAFILLNRSPFLIRPASIAVRYSFTIAVPLIFLGLLLSFLPSGLKGAATGMVATLGLFGMGLTGLWASGQSESAIISGLLPWQDSNMYYLDALRWLQGFDVTEKTSMRPLFTALLSFLLGLTGKNLQFAIALLVGITGFSAFFFTQKLKEYQGPFAAAFALTLIFLYYRRIIGTTLTENLGLTFSLLGFAFLIIGLQKTKKVPILFGIFLVSLSLNTRPGPFFILPTLILWGAWLFRDPSGASQRGFFSMLTFSSLAVLAAFLINTIIQKATSSTDLIPFANFAYAFYGLATGGKQYIQIFIDHPELSQLSGNAQYFAVFKMAFDVIKTHPIYLVQGIFKNLKDFLSPTTWYGIFGYVDSDSFVLSTLVRSLLEGLSAITLFAYFKKRDHPLLNLVFYVTLTTLLSVPFVPPGDAYKLRLYAAVIPLIGMLPALGLVEAFKWLNFGKNLERLSHQGHKFFLKIDQKLRALSASDGQYEFPNGALGAFSLVLILLVVGGPLFARWVSLPADITPIECTKGQQALYIEYRAGSFVSIWPEDRFFLDWLPNVHSSRFQKFIHGLPDAEQMSNFQSIRAPAVLFSTVDAATGGEYWVVVNPDLLPDEKGVLMDVCGKKEGFLFEVEQVQYLAE